MFLLGIYLRVAWLGHGWVCLCLSLADSAKQVLEVVVPIYLPSSGVWSLCWLHMLTNPSKWNFNDGQRRDELLCHVPYEDGPGRQLSSTSGCFPIQLTLLCFLTAPYRCEWVWNETPAMPTQMCEYAWQLQVLLPQRPHAHAGCHVCG